MPAKLKGKVYKTVARPALLYGAETWATTRGQEARLEVNEMRMLRWMCGVTRRDKIRNDHIRGTTRVVQASKKISEKRLKWYGHVSRMKDEHIVRRMLDVEIPGKRRRGRPNLRWKDACKKDMTEVVLKKDKTTNRAAWRNTIISYTGDPRWRDKPGKGKKERSVDTGNGSRTQSDTHHVTGKSCSNQSQTSAENWNNNSGHLRIRIRTILFGLSRPLLKPHLAAVAEASF